MTGFTGAAQPKVENAHAAAPCANCAQVLTGPFCARCGQSARDIQRPFLGLLADALGDVFSLDARLVRTLRPLLLKPGQVTKEYLAGRRVAHVPPLRAYLISALIFFGLFTVFPTRRPPVYVYTTGSAEAAAVKGSSSRGSRVIIELPERVWFGNRFFQEKSARARANPDAFALASYRNVPRAFFLFLPIFALMLELFYRKQGYYIDHLVFSLYYHAFAFLVFAALFVIGRMPAWVPGPVVLLVQWSLITWLAAYLAIALRRTYGGSWPKTALKVIGLSVLYLIGFVVIGFSFIMFMTLLTF